MYLQTQGRTNTGMMGTSALAAVLTCCSLNFSVFILSHAVTGSSSFVVAVCILSTRLFFKLYVQKTMRLCALNASLFKHFLNYSPVQGDGRHGVNAGKYSCDGEKVVEAAVA